MSDDDWLHDVLYLILNLQFSLTNDFFEDTTGYSNYTREELAKYLVGTLKVDEALLKKRADAAAKAESDGGGNSMGILFAILAIVAAYYYKTQMM